MGKRGPKPWEPTQKERDEVQALIGFGLTVDQVARIKGVCRQTIHDKFQDEIEAGRPFALAQVAQTLFKMATSGKHLAATFFYLKTIGGWRETGASEVADALKGFLSVEKFDGDKI